MMPCRHTFVSIDMTALRSNAQSLRAFLPDSVHLMAVVKANAYGHGMVESARAFLRGGADHLAVALAEEGVLLRDKGVTCPILVLGPMNEEGFLAAAEHGLIPTLHCPENLPLAEKTAQQYGIHMPVHLKVDTGMSRIGFREEGEWRQALETLLHSVNLDLTGVYTHFADADDQDSAFTQLQLDKFKRFTLGLPATVLRHAAASAATLHLPETHLDMVRVGIALYGYPPVPTPLPLESAMQFITEVTALRTIEQGDFVSYGCTFRADEATRVATLGVGYGDGYPRYLSGKGEVLIRGKRCRVLGRVCMDQTMVNVSNIPDVQVGDKAVLMGAGGAERIGADDLARLTDTITYEVLLSPKERVPKRYTNKIEEDDDA